MRDLSRQAVIDRLRQDPSVEVLVIGAGINGAAVFRELALNGVRVLLVDRGDIAEGASSALSRMVHGGLRYLETADFALVREGATERNRLLRNAPHLVGPLRTVVPLYDLWGGTLAAVARFFRRPVQAGRRGAVLVRIGLALYDWLGRRERTMPRHRMLGRDAALAAMPGLTRSIASAAEYWDGWVAHPERINLELVLDALHAAPLAEALTYAAAEGIGAEGVTIRDGTTGETLRIAPRLVVNAAGAWIDRVNAPMGINQRMIGGTKGSHLVIDHDGLRAALGDAMLYFEAPDGRTCIVFPYLGNVLLGTTDIRVEDADGVHCTEAEVDYLLAVLHQVLPNLAIGREHIRFRYSGVRPLPHVDAATPSMIPRSHSLVASEATPQRPFPVLSMVSGKWTTFRAFGEQAADEVLRRLGRVHATGTQALPIGGGAGFPADRAAWLREVARETGIAEARIDALLARYGTRARDAARAIAAGPDAPLATLPDHSTGEIAWIARGELVTRLSDVILRRTLVALRGQASEDAVREVAAVLADTLGWSPHRRAAEEATTLAVLRDRHGAGQPMGATQPVSAMP
ncbi:glycerol-3-phosphate dehydrogenase/oxidase [Roseomonas fluvialis]|uniref:Glycerol-3-phosphate dehydrogenase n=1 Tax=Roseomonas fluvialis TaxID=1750527 RepID=A0ABM7XXB5_9PROT|nr:glycerol-3-phosphate dehydrogenase/oxidase [Roseomonas fluvialis]BDG70108.1 glycerol-3-phosphate dehydrogenase [Roseomonas fluvialis]